MPASPLILTTDRGLYCPAGDFYIDAWAAVPRTIVTHAHSDHARRGSARYLCASDGVHVLRQRMGADATIDSIEYGQPIEMNGVRVSLHPAGHLLGSARCASNTKARSGSSPATTSDRRIRPVGLSSWCRVKR